jgi:hypothetical protein
LKKGQKKSHPVNRTASNDCLPYKKTYFFVAESTLALTVSIADLTVESILAFAVSPTALTVESTALAAESTAVVELDPLLQAAKQPTANTSKSFFMVILFLFIE